MVDLRSALVKESEKRKEKSEKRKDDRYTIRLRRND